MIRNYFKVALRNLSRNRTVSIINIAGLSIGLACCMLIMLYIKDDWSFDRFHRHRNELFRLTMQVLNADGSFRANTPSTGTNYGAAFKQEIPGISDYSRLSAAEYVIRKDDRVLNQHVVFADSNFFSVFTFPILHGNPATALTDPHGIVISEKAAKKYFGETDVLGKTLDLEVDKKFVPFTIAAVARDCPLNSSIKFDILLPMKFYEAVNGPGGWMTFDVNTFLLLNPGANADSVLAKMRRVYEAQSAPDMKAARSHGFQFSYIMDLQPLLQLHLGKTFGIDEYSDRSDPIYGYILGGIAGFILLIACINFVNLTIARSLKRAKEIGIRKVVGGSRSQLILQFLGESFVACGISFALAIGLAMLALPVFNKIADKQLSFSYLADTRLVLEFIGFLLITCFAAGFYPALVLSGFKPVETLYQRFRLSGRNYLAKGLIVLQFAFAGLFIICTFFISEQFHYLTHKDLGYNDSDLLTVNIQADSGRQFVQLFRHELLTHPGIRSVARHNAYGRMENAKVNDRQILFAYEHIDENYFNTLQIPFVLGRNFSSAFPTDSIRSVIVNETFAKDAGWTDPIGKTIEFPSNHQVMTVVGVVRDYNYYPLNSRIDPMLFSAEPFGDDLEFNIKIAPADRPATLAIIGSTFKKLAPFYPFNWTFKRDDNLHAYDAQFKWKQIVTFAAVFTIFISCIGLFGLVTLTTQRRTRELGIRKVLGASVANLVRLLTVNFLVLVFLANLIAIPIAWWAMDKWLQNFAYRINLQWWAFALTTLFTLLIAFSTVAFQALKAAIVNPVINLRVE